MSLEIVHISSDDVTGGAARCAYRLHRGLLDLGHDSRMLVSRRRSSDPTVERYRPPRDTWSRVRRRLRRAWIEREHARYAATRPDWPERFSDDRSWLAVERHTWLATSDVVNLHWVAGLVDYRRLFQALAGGPPVVWTLHDMNAFTGGCHYDDGCGRFTDRCGACPQLGSDDPRDLSHRIWRRKRELFRRLDPGRLQIVTPSRWLAREVRRSSVFADRFRVSVIPYGLDTETFSPRDRGAARETLGIPRDARVILFVAQVVGIRRKGFTRLQEALAALPRTDDLFLLSVGTGHPDVPSEISHRHVGNLGDDRLLSLVYSAADVFVVPSLQDNLPATVLEAIACGTPVVGFEVGGIPEMVRPGRTGALAAPGDAGALAAALQEVLEDPARRDRWASTCRRVAVEEYGLAVQASRYFELYDHIVGGRSSGPLNKADPTTRTPAESSVHPTAYYNAGDRG